MNIEKLKNTVFTYMQIWNANSENLLDTLAHPDIQVYYSHFQKPIRGVIDYKTMLQVTYAFLPDIKIEVKEIYLNDLQHATVFWQYTGSHQNGNLFGAEPSGKIVTVSGISLLVVDQELIIKEKGIVDNLSLVQQLGLLK